MMKGSFPDSSGSEEDQSIQFGSIGNISSLPSELHCQKANLHHFTSSGTTEISLDLHSQSNIMLHQMSVMCMYTYTQLGFNEFCVIQIPWQIVWPCGRPEKNSFLLERFLTYRFSFSMDECLLLYIVLSPAVGSIVHAVSFLFMMR